MVKWPPKPQMCILQIAKWLERSDGLFLKLVRACFIMVAGLHVHNSAKLYSLDLDFFTFIQKQQRYFKFACHSDILTFVACLFFSNLYEIHQSWHKINMINQVKAYHMACWFNPDGTAIILLFACTTKLLLFQYLWNSKWEINGHTAKFSKKLYCLLNYKM